MSDDVEDIKPNDQLLLVSGKSGTGKSASLRNIRNQKRWVYLNCEAGKKLPFRNEFQSATIIDPYDTHAYFDECTANIDDVDGIILDTITFLMDMFETQYVLAAKDTQKGWANFAQFFKILLQQKVAAFGKPVIILAHTLEKYNEQSLEYDVSVPIKGALKNQGVEAYFSTVVSTKKMALSDLKDFESNLLNITEDDEDLGFKHVFQTRLTKKTTGERIRSPMGMFTRKQTFTDNDVQMILDHMHQFYN